MDFTEKELEQIKYALEYLHDADLSDYGEENIIVMESLMKKLGMKFSSQIDSMPIDLDYIAIRNYK